MHIVFNCNTLGHAVADAQRVSDDFAQHNCHSQSELLSQHLGHRKRHCDALVVSDVFPDADADRNGHAKHLWHANSQPDADPKSIRVARGHCKLDCISDADANTDPERQRVSHGHPGLLCVSDAERVLNAESQHVSGAFAVKFGHSVLFGVANFDPKQLRNAVNDELADPLWQP